MNLKSQTQNLLKEYEVNVPEKEWSIINAATENLKKQKNKNIYVKVGDKFPNSLLKNVNGKSEEISDIITENEYVVVSFYRGSWCTFCNLELIHLNKIYSEFREMYTEVVVISPENIDDSKLLINELGIQLKVLQDVDNNLAKKLGLGFTVPEDLNEIYLTKFNINLKESNNSNDNVLPITATYVINKNSEIIESFIDEDFTNRMEPAEIIKIIRENGK